MADPFSAQEIIRRETRLRSDRAATESHWQEVADYTMPSREFQLAATPGAKRQAKIYHIGPVLAAEQLAGALHGMLTSPALRWFAIRPDTAEAQRNQDSRIWFYQVTEAMYRAFTSPAMRFDLHLHENYLDQASFGTSVMFESDRGRRGPGFQALPLAECVFSENDEGIIDTLYRAFTMRAMDVVTKWAKDVPEERRRDAENKPDDRWECIHGVIPNPKSPGRYAGVYVLKRSMSVLGGTERYEDKPFIAARWSKRSGEMYGTGCGMNALPMVKRLNMMAEEELRGIMLATRPPIALPDDGFLTPVAQAPGRVHFYRSEDPRFQDRVFPLNFGERPELATEATIRMEEWIDRAYQINWMNLPFRPNMTATEIIQRRDDMLRLMGPIVARLQTELLGPTIERTFNVMWRAGMFPPPPTSLSGMKWHIEYLSPLALAQKSSDATAALNFMAALGQIAAGDPTVLDNVDGDEMTRFLADRMGAPAQVVRADAVVRQLRDARAKRDQAAQQAMMMDSMSKSLQQGGAGAASLADAFSTAQGAQPGAQAV